MQAAVPARPALWLRVARAHLSVPPQRVGNFGLRAARAIPVASVGVVIAVAHGKCFSIILGQFYNASFTTEGHNDSVDLSIYVLKWPNFLLEALKMRAFNLSSLFGIFLKL